MIKKPITIRLSSGLEARPVAMLVQVASQYESEIYVLQREITELQEEIANGKDESEAMDGVEKYLSSPSAE